jgi:hypothetical protein
LVTDMMQESAAAPDRNLLILRQDAVLATHTGHSDVASVSWRRVS